MDRIWKARGEVAGFLEYFFIGYGIPILHLVRKNILRTLLTKERAKKIDEWVW
jgi:hypothetical protein